MNKPQPASLYESEKKIYPREMGGRFDTLSKIATTTLLGLFYVVPWLTWDDRQAILFDLPARKFYLLGLTLWPQDFPYLALLLVIAALSLFFFTALAGRLWCGFACPQTVWTEAFIWMEQITEGTRSQRMKLDKAPWSFNKFRRKASKQFLWVTFSLWTGFTFVGFFAPIRELGHELLTFNAGGWQWFWALFYGFATYGNAGYMREQVCKYMCPYARFQSAMFDKDTLIISYDEKRGEPRGGRKRSVDPKVAGLGDCIDCSLCVQVCPTGIDIRDGLQYECIACAACIDACDSVMDKMSYPRGLIRYTTEHALQNEQTHVIRPRMLVYAALLLVLIGSLVTSMALRTPIILDVIRDRNALYRELPNDIIENSYTIKLINQTNDAREFRLRVTGVDGIHLDGITDTFTIAGGGVLSVPVRARVHRGNARGVAKIDFIAEALDDSGDMRIEDSRFLGPTP
ncbi:MAG: cytochrome c oxidase accessory protein CcoG [Gammaproteobacteria bacterium]|nr:cytochrome c oxidase accessory protein CcoG [Gammaproteobacteria bacterium]MDH5240669.1 cytochrome c oxidase accessory protein CcoG [Gammaproteobacteria bacterium]MDH5260530.1 cytochrome c oxidase accessory protein CcoG [Gammaproteobacteria bacterium]MDH5583793.1 cytochrome c oxidase accessory protein CcoG [Gammaproteobacteria bacterium]